MTLSLKELREWVPEIADLAEATRNMATNHTNSTQFYQDVVKASSWQGEAAQAAMTSMLLAAAAHDVKAADLSAAGGVMNRAGQDAQKLSETIAAILDDAAQNPAVTIDQSTNQVSPPSNYDYLDDETQAKVGQKIADLRTRLADALTEGDRIDADLARAIAAATGTPAPMKTPTSLGEMLGVPANGPQPAPLSEERRSAIEYADRWVGNIDDPHRANPEYQNFGDGGDDCTNFASQVMRAGGLKDVGDGIDDWHRGDADDWYYDNGFSLPGNTNSNTWSVAQANRDFIVNSGRGEVVATSPMPASGALDPLSPSKAGLIPGDLIYYHDSASGTINHTAVYVGQKMENGILVDVVDQHANGDNNFRNDWTPDGEGFTDGSASVEFVHVSYPGE